MPGSTKSKKAAFRLTEKNYFSPDKPHISVSKIKDYFRCPQFYKRRYIDRDPAVQFHVTGPVKRGSIVDDFLTRGRTEIQMKVLKKNDPDLYEAQQSIDDRFLVEERYWTEAMEIIRALRVHPAWTENLGGAEMQYVLEGMIGGMPVCGLADRVEVMPDGTVRLIDLKVVSPIKQDSPRRWGYNVVEMGYDMQFALYQRLLATKLGIPKEKILCAHVVASYVEPGLIKVGIYIVPQSVIDMAMPRIEWAIGQIKAKNFAPNLVTWKDAALVPHGNQEDITDDDDEVSE